MSQDFMGNFGIIIPQGPFVERKPKPVARWRKLVCFLIGHKWGSAGITYEGPGFPRKCSRCEKKKWFKRPTIRMRLSKWADRTLDKLWPLLCKAGIHRYKSHYGYSSYTYGGPPTKPINQHIYKCSCCKKIKTVTL